MSSTERSHTIGAHLQNKLKNFVKEQTKRRCKGFLQSVHEAINTFQSVVTLDTDIDIPKYSIPKDLYDGFIGKVNVIIGHKCEVGINADRVTKKNVATWIRLQNFWLHIAPETSTKHFYNKLLKMTANYFDNLSFDTAHNIPLNIAQIREFLKKMFLFHLMTAHLQQNKQSTKRGSIIQDKAWKQTELQNIITEYFDPSYKDQWCQWMQSTTVGKNNKSKSMRIGTIMKTFIKPFVKYRLSECAQRLRLNIRIKEVTVTPNKIQLFDEILICEDEINASMNASVSETHSESLMAEGIIVGSTHSPNTEQFPMFESWNDFGYQSLPPCIAPPMTPFDSVTLPPPNMDTCVVNNNGYNTYGPCMGAGQSVERVRYSPLNAANYECNAQNNFDAHIRMLEEENQKFRAYIEQCKRMQRQYFRHNFDAMMECDPFAYQRQSVHYRNNNYSYLQSNPYYEQPF